MDNIHETIMKYGVDAVKDTDILTSLTGITEDNAGLFLQEHSLADLVKYVDVYNITKAQKRKLLLLYDFVRRVSTAKYKDKTLLDSSTRTGEFFIVHSKFHRTEVLKAALLDAQNRLITVVVLAKGTLNEAPIYPREIIRKVLNYNANSVILCHNHPGGSLSFSNSDIQATKKVAQALETIAVKLVDHILVSEDKYSSMAEKGLIP
jgi:DNA repair protein RadC